MTLICDFNTYCDWANHDLPRFQGVLRVEEIYELMASRTDYKKIQKYVESKECLIM
jgi:recyclin-1